MLQRILITTGVLLVLPLRSAEAQFAQEDADASGVLNPSDSSYRAYREAIRLFPDRVGTICHAAYLLDKTGSFTNETLEFLETCAENGSVASMVYLAILFERGNRMPVSYKRAAYWYKRAADANKQPAYARLGAYHYGVALLEGRGVERDIAQARRYLSQAAEKGLPEAAAALRDLDGRRRSEG